MKTSEKRNIVDAMSEETFVDHWENDEEWGLEVRIEQHRINSSDYYVAIDTSGSDHGIGVAGVIDVSVDYSELAAKLTTLHAAQ